MAGKVFQEGTRLTWIDGYESSDRQRLVFNWRLVVALMVNCVMWGEAASIFIHG